MVKLINNIVRYTGKIKVMQPLNIMVVEDEGLVSLYLQKTLKELGYSIFGFAFSGSEAIEKATGKGQKPDLVLMDYNLKGKMNGVETARLLNQTLDIPIIFLTAYSDKATLEEITLSAPFGYLLKPVDERILHTTIETAISRHRLETKFKEQEQYVRNLNDELERRVQARTAELEAANLKLTNQIVQRTSLENELRFSLEKEKELVEMKNQLISTVSHEFRTPLSVIISSTELLEYYSHRWSEEKKGEIIGRISQSATKLTGLIEDILTYTRGEEGKVNFVRGKVVLSNLCRDLVNGFQLNAGDDKTVQFVEIEVGPKPEVYLDEKLLTLILNNLISNALKYSKPGGEVVLELTWHQQEIVFKVKDAGIGIPFKDQANLFEPFHRASNVGTISGTGFGLAIVKRSVLSHKGQINFESREGLGTTFTFNLPLNYSAEEDSSPQLAPGITFLTQDDPAMPGGNQSTDENSWLLEQAINASSLGILITNASGSDNSIIYASRGFENLTGFSREEVKGRDCRFLQGEDHNQPALTDLRQALKDERDCQVTLRNYRKDGSLFWNELHLSPIRDRSGKVIYFVGMLNDVGDHVRALEALNKSEQNFKSLLENSPNLVARFDRNARYLYANPTLEKISQGTLTPEIVTGQSHLELGFSDELLESFEDHIKKVVGTGEAVSFEVAPETLDQQVKYFQVQMVPEFSLDEKEVVSVLTIGRDVTEFKQADIALRASQAHLGEILESITDAFFSLDSNWKFTYLNPRAEKLLQRTSQELIGQGIWEIFSKAVGSLSYKLYQLARQEMVAVSFEDYNASLQKWFEVHAYPSVRGLAVYFQDITIRKEFQEALSQSEVRFRSLVENGSDIITLIGIDNLIKYVSPSVERTLGYKPEDLIGQNWLDRLLPQEATETKKLWADLLEKPGETVTIEMQYLHQDGSRHYSENTFQNLLHLPGVEAVVVNSRDIHDRKLTQEALRKNEQEYRLLMEQAPDAIYICDQTEKILFVNEACCTLMGYRREELLQMSITDLAPRNIKENMRAPGSVLIKNQTVSALRKVRRKDGSWIILEANLRLLEDNRMVGIVRNIAKDSAPLEESSQMV